MEAGDARQEGGREGQAGGAGRPRQARGGETQRQHPGLEETADREEGRRERQAVSSEAAIIHPVLTHDDVEDYILS